MRAAILKMSKKPIKSAWADIPKQSPAGQIEHRALIKGSKVEIRAGAEGAMPTLIGYAAVFNKRTSFLWFEEEVAPGAFAKSLTDGDDVRALCDHNTAVAGVLGRRSPGTLRLEEDAIGLRVEIDLPATSAGRDLVANIEAGNIDGMSFGFRAREERWIDGGEKDKDVRILEDVELIEVSVVTFPQYEDTSIAKRSHEDYCKAHKPAQKISAPGGADKKNAPAPSQSELRRRLRARRIETKK